jgi:hypothetical protein
MKRRRSSRSWSSAWKLIPERRGAGFASLAGAWRGKVKVADDFDDLPDDLADALGMRS